MSVRVRSKVAVEISSNINEEKDLANFHWSSVNDASGEGGGKKLSIPESTTDYLVSLDNISTARLLFVKCSAEVSVKLNSAVATAIVVKPMITTGEGLLLLTGSVTALYITNANGTPVDLLVATAGD